MLATLCVDVLLAFWLVCAVADEAGDLSEVAEFMGTGIVAAFDSLGMFEGWRKFGFACVFGQVAAQADIICSRPDDVLWRCRCGWKILRHVIRHYGASQASQLWK